jgi:AcrR family transcriptional regulator
VWHATPRPLFATGCDVYVQYPEKEFAMARKPAENPAADAPRADPRAIAIDALMALVAEYGWKDVELPQVAERAGMPLSALRDLFPSKGAMLAGFGRMLDKAVLDTANPDLVGEPAQERVFDLMMRRIDAMVPYKPALLEIRRAIRSDLVSAAALNRAALNSWRYMLGSVGIPVEDELGMLKIQGAVIVFARTADTWLDDTDASMAKTMARLDKELKNGARVLGFAEDARRLLAPFRSLAQAICERAPKMGRRERARNARSEDGDSYRPAI